VQRWFAVLEGAGVALNIAGKQHTQTKKSAPLCFDGSAATDCRLIGGETRDFNLMLDRCLGTMQTMTGKLTYRATTGQWLAVYSHSHQTTLESQGQRLHVPPQHLVWTQCDTDCDITVSSECALWMQTLL
jgi:uncharacterized protein